MRIVRHGNPKGLDIDYKVFVESVEEIEQVHDNILSKGFVFLYQKGDIPYNPTHKGLIVLHYIDKNLKLYDYAFIFPNTSKEKESQLKSQFDIELDKAYAKARIDRRFHEQLMYYMKFHILLQAIWKHMKAYGSFDEHILAKILKKIQKETGLQLETTVTIDSLRGLDTRIKHFFGV
jgi:hypothetical protein